MSWCGCWFRTTGWHMRVEPAREPRRIVVKLTDRCNMSCGFCAQAKNRSRGVSRVVDLEFEHFERFFRTPFEDNNKLLFLWGGEPLMHPRWRDFAEFGRRRGWRVQLNTNGWLIHENLDALPILVDDLIISLDGLSETHDRLRRRTGAFRRVKQSISRLVREGGPLARSVSINTVITEALLDELPAFVKEVMSWGVRGIVLELPTFIPADQESAVKSHFSRLGWCYDHARAYIQDYSAFPSARFIELYKKLLEIHGGRIGLTPVLRSSTQVRAYFATSRPLGLPYCPEINHGLVLEPDGRIVSCSDFPDTCIGSFIDTEWQAAWRSPAYAAVRRAFDDNHPPAVCLRCCQTVWEVQSDNLPQTNVDVAPLRRT